MYIIHCSNVLLAPHFKPHVSQPIWRTGKPEGPTCHQLTDQAACSKAQLECLCFSQSGPFCAVMLPGTGEERHQSLTEWFE